MISYWKNVYSDYMRTHESRILHITFNTLLNISLGTKRLISLLTKNVSKNYEADCCISFSQRRFQIHKWANNKIICRKKWYRRKQKKTELFWEFLDCFVIMNNRINLGPAHLLICLNVDPFISSEKIVIIIMPIRNVCVWDGFR